MFVEGQKIYAMVTYGDGKKAEHPGIIVEDFDANTVKVFTVGLIMTLNRSEVRARDA